MRVLMRPRQFASTAFIISAMAIFAQPAEKIPEFGPASVKVNAPGAGLQTGLAENPGRNAADGTRGKGAD
jgi:hypothetical protein